MEVANTDVNVGVNDTFIVGREGVPPVVVLVPFWTNVRALKINAPTSVDPLTNVEAEMLVANTDVNEGEGTTSTL